MNLDTFLVTVYCMIDDAYRAKFRALKPVRPGHRPELSDSEVLTLATIAQWWHDWSERDYLAYVGRHWHAYFPRRLSQSAYNRRCRDRWAVLCELSTKGGKELNGSVPAELFDAVPVPLMRRCRGRCHRLFACEAASGRGGSDRAWYYGVSLLLSVTPHGVITGWVSGPASTEGRWLAESLLRWRTDPTLPAAALADLHNQLPPSHHRPRTGPHGPIRPAQAAGTPVTCLAGDAGFRGAAWQHHWQQAYGATVVTPPPLPHPFRRVFDGFRQIIEQVNSSLTVTFGLAFPRARTPGGLLVRLAARVAAHNIQCRLNHALGQGTLAHFRAF